jgi:hypothetical protein
VMLIEKTAAPRARRHFFSATAALLRHRRRRPYRRVGRPSPFQFGRQPAIDEADDRGVPVTGPMPRRVTRTEKPSLRPAPCEV